MSKAVGGVFPGKVDYRGEIYLVASVEFYQKHLMCMTRLGPIYFTACDIGVSGDQEYPSKLSFALALSESIDGIFELFKEALDPYVKTIRSIMLTREIEFFKLVKGRDERGKEFTYCIPDHSDFKEIKLEKPCDLEKLRPLFVDFPEAWYVRI